MYICPYYIHQLEIYGLYKEHNYSEMILNLEAHVRVFNHL